MIPLQNLIPINRSQELAVYLQISNGIIQLIKNGQLAGGSRLPGTRALGELFGVHRKTAVAAYDELLSQGWIEVRPSQGTYVSEQLPTVSPREIGDGLEIGQLDQAGFRFHQKLPLHRILSLIPDGLTLDEGIPDVRIAPVDDIIRHYKSIVARSYNQKLLTYGSVYGDDMLRETLATYLQETRGMKVEKANIMITRGSQMGMYLSSQLLFRQGELAVVGETNYIASNLTMQDAGATIRTIPVDEKGIDTSALTQLCKKEQVRAVFVTSHHHHPTTVTLSADRRIELLQLAEKYGFAILEDDYDYDFHYRNAPLLPLASADHTGQVIYMGAICKIVAPAYRVGYLVAPKDFIEEAGHLRRTIDRQGDAILERAIALMIRQGDFQRHTKKALKIYRERRDHFCGLLSKELSSFLSFEVPEGGLAVWVKLKQGLDWLKVAKECLNHGLLMPNYKNYNYNNTADNGIRMGFASSSPEEQIKIISILKEVMSKYSN
ncbi:PLP-dependent aminotransferase family protein [Roseivirga sp.]|uniref:aminotransferase-like domain-containing protein n=1 Tax=Roseivirga sp. TaxID=1964215 RepID=UPI003B523666